MEVEFTNKEINWYADRVDESPTGRLIISSHLVNKYRKKTGNYLDDNSLIRDEIIRLTNRGLGI